MSDFVSFCKRLAVGFLCLLLLISLVFIETKEVAAKEIYIDRVEITTDRPLHQYTDIAAFLKSVKIVSPKKGAIKSFDFRLYYNDSKNNQVDVSSGKADVRTYVFEIDIELQPDYYFNVSTLYITLNKMPVASMATLPGGGFPNMVFGEWDLISRPRYKVTFDADGGTPVPSVQWVVEGQKVKVPKKPTKAGHEFLGWWHDVATPPEKWDFDTHLVENLPLTAHWKALPATKTTTTLETAPSTLLTDETSTTMPESIESTTTSEAVVPDTSYSEPDEPTSPSEEKGGKGGFSLITFLFTLGGVILLAVFGFIMYKLGRGKNK